MCSPIIPTHAAAHSEGEFDGFSPNFSCVRCGESELKTFIVRIPSTEFICNAESPEEAVAYMIARTNITADKYIVYDHDLNRWEVTPNA